MDEIKNKIKAVIFDMDGTIIETEHIWGRVSAQVLMEVCNVNQLNEQHHQFLQTLSGIGLEKSVSELKKTFSVEKSEQEILARKIELANLYFKEAYNSIEFIAGFENFHKRLQASIIPTSVATNCDASSFKQIANTLNFERFFGKNLYCIADVNHKAKPDPAIFLHAAQQLGVTPEECVVFEDSLFGFQAAKAAGMRCIAIKNNLNGKYLDQVHNAIDDYSQAEGALKKLALL